MNTPNTSNRQFYPDFIRVTAMLFILIYHFQTELFARTSYLDNHHISITNKVIDTWGSIGVVLFLALSGACLTISGRSISLGQFYKRRFISIFPLYYIVWGMAFCGTLLFLPNRLDGIAPWTILLTILGLDGYLLEVIPNFYMTGEWFLGCLILLYAVYPLLKHFMTHHSPTIVWGITLICYPLCVLFYPFSFSIGRMFYLHIPEFMFGMYVMYYLSSYTFGQALLCFILSIMCIVLYPICTPIATAGMGVSLFMILRNLGYILQCHNFIRVQKIIRTIASYSYEVFLLHHFYLNLFLEKFFSNTTITTFAAILLFIFWCGSTLFVSWCLHVAFQLICIHFKRLFD